MSKIGLIIEREYLTRVKKKSFVVMTLLTPFLFALLIFIPIWLATSNQSEKKLIEVYDQSGSLFEALESNEIVEFVETNAPDKAKSELKDSQYDGLLIIGDYKSINVEPTVQLFFYDQPSIDILNHIENNLSKFIEKQKLSSYEIDDIDTILKSIKTDIDVKTIKLSESGEEKQSSFELAMIISYLVGIVLYMFIFLYGVQVMRGVMEEKTNRIVEVVVSSVKPFELMMGKVVGVALVGLTQCLMFIIFTTLLVQIGGLFFMPDLSASTFELSGIANTEGEDMLSNIMSLVSNLDIPLILFSFFVYFLGGYLLYASLFAAIGGAVDNEADTQQFMTPITIPLILAIIGLTAVLTDPSGPIAFWGSMIPLTSPIIMMARVPYGVPMSQLIISIVLLLASIVGAIWMAAKIYRVGILMYGKKVTWSELWKWIRYKN